MSDNVKEIEVNEEVETNVQPEPESVPEREPFIKVETKEDFSTIIDEIKSSEGFYEPLGFAIARSTKGHKSGNTINVSYPFLNWTGENLGSFAVIYDYLKKSKDGIIDVNNDEVVIELTDEDCKCLLDYFAPFAEEYNEDKNKHKNIHAIVLALHTMSDPRTDPTSTFSIVIKKADTQCSTVETAYMKLIAMSQQKALPRSLNLDCIFGLLPNVAWTGVHCYELDYLRENEIEMRMTDQYPVIDYIDKFPRFLMHVLPADNTRILESSKVRLGAYLADGTTVMPGASYINFNAGTLGACMVEGRVSSSVIVGEGTDVGGGASIAGVLSGGNSDPISVGKDCLLGANASLAISLGDGCIIDLGTAVASGTKVKILSGDWDLITELNPNADIKYYHRECADENTDSQCTYYVKAAQLSGLNGIHFRLDSNGDGIIAFRSSYEVKLNEDLH